MESKGNRTIEGIRFESEKEYEAACKELETIREIERKFAIGDPKIALSIYNKAVSKKSFKTIIGYKHFFVFFVTGDKLYIFLDFSTSPCIK